MSEALGVDVARAEAAFRKMASRMPSILEPGPPVYMPLAENFMGEFVGGKLTGAVICEDDGEPVWYDIKRGKE